MVANHASQLAFQCFIVYIQVGVVWRRNVTIKYRQIMFHSFCASNLKDEICQSPVNIVLAELASAMTSMWAELKFQAGNAVWRFTLLEH